MIPCSKCKKTSVVFLQSSGTNLCKKHFMHHFERRFYRTIREFSMLKGVKHMGVAVSGGKDSLVTLALLSSICNDMGIKVTALTVDEGICGYRPATIANARAFCRKIRVKHNVFSLRKSLGVSIDGIKKKNKHALACTYCGVFRRWALNKLAQASGCDRLATGHNLDDVSQTVLMNILRNEPMRLSRFGPVGGDLEDDAFTRRVKPLFKIPEKEVALYAILSGIPASFTECPYASDAFRNHVREFLNDLEEKIPGTKYRVENAFLKLLPLLKTKAGSLNHCSICKEPCSSSVCQACSLLSSIKKGVFEKTKSKRC